MTKKRTQALDALDRRLLARWQHDTRRSAESLGEEIGLSAAAVQRRLKRLRESGVIEAEIAVVDPSAVGVPLSCIVTVDVDRERSADIDAFSARMRACEAVQQVFYVTGQADFVLVVAVEDMAAYEAFTREHLLNDANVRSFTTHVVLRALKRSLAVPLS